MPAHSEPHTTTQAIRQDILLETAEGIEIEFQPAGLAIRSMAFMFDFSLRVGIFILFAILSSFFGEFGAGLMLISAFLLEWFYPILFEYYWGATPGKKITGLKVIYANGLPLTLPGAMTRNLFRAIDFLPFGYCVGAICLVTNQKFQRVGDWVAGTMVVYEDQPIEYTFAETKHSYTPEFVLSTQEQTAVIRFAERSKTLSESRTDELAQIMAPLLKSPHSATDCLKSLANRYIGK